MTSFKAEIITKGKDRYQFSLGNVFSNGWASQCWIAFANPDPQIILNFEQPLKIDFVKIKCQIKPMEKQIMQSFYGIRRFLDEGKIYFNYGVGFSEKEAIKYYSISNKKWNFCTEVLSGDKNVYDVRFDPCNSGPIIICYCKIEIMDNEGNKRIYLIEDMQTNGILFKEAEIFIHDDPWLRIHFDVPVKIKRIRVAIAIQEGIPEKFQIVYQQTRDIISSVSADMQINGKQQSIIHYPLLPSAMDSKWNFVVNFQKMLRTDVFCLNIKSLNCFIIDDVDIEIKTTQNMRYIYSLMSTINFNRKYSKFYTNNVGEDKYILQLPDEIEIKRVRVAIRLNYHFGKREKLIYDLKKFFYRNILVLHDM